jgi:hypothetical protein
VSPREQPVGTSQGESSSEVFTLPTGASATNGAAAAASVGGHSAPGAALAAGGESLACANCGAPLAADQRYCLACGQPASPVRLAFLDVLQGEYQPSAASGAGIGIPGGAAPAGYYAPAPEPDGLVGALRRYSGLLALVGVLLAALLIGLLVGHWISGGSGSSSPGKQVIEVKGLSGGAAVAPTTTTAPGGSGSGSSTNEASGENGAQEHSSAKQEAKEVKEVKAAKAPPVVHKKTSAQSLQKLNKTTGKQHAKEVNELIKGDEPIETGH